MPEAAARRPRNRNELVDRLATASFTADGLVACTPAMEYGSEFQARTAQDLATLPEGSALVEMMGDYAVLREQVRGCRGYPRQANDHSDR